ncbi:pentapeptide repeat-containing protein [Streptomyces cyaneogriseus]|uniref:pentapeptide repeat-containing protein n=1 Tax=Streptomyces cyaneogriseus TaxID=68192 RepID=UPI00099C0C12|nr:pentapeptide repeat-containing protein [Streptomyces cyaneogriseus]
MRKQRGLVILGGVAIASAALGAVLLVWRGPWWFDGEFLSDRELRTGSSALVTGFRTSVVQLFAVFGAGIALLFTAFNYRLTQRGQVTERFTKALERLGSSEMYVRIGGLLALEQIVQDAPGQADHATQVLKAFVRDRASRGSAPRPASRSARIAAARRAARNGGSPPSAASARKRPDADVQQAVTTLVGPPTYGHPDDDIWEWEGGGGHVEARAIDLSDLDLAGVNFHRADLCGVRFDGADLSQASMTRSYLQGASMEGANLTGALMYRANLNRARLKGADLTDAYIDGADLQNSYGLTVEQVLVAEVTSRTSLPSRIAQDPRVLARAAEVEKRIDEGFNSNLEKTE